MTEKKPTGPLNPKTHAIVRPMHPVKPLDPIDPHGEHAQEAHHGHVIVRVGTLTAVLVILMVFTVLTVAASRAEIYIGNTFGVEIPQWVNVSVALSIAVVKSILVAMFFMQLKYDNQLNTLIVLFSLSAFGLFLFFPMTDLGTRGVIYSYKAEQHQYGGLGIDSFRGRVDAAGKPIEDEYKRPVGRGINTGNKPIVVWAAERRIAEIEQDAKDGKIQLHGLTPLQYFEHEKAMAHGGHHDAGPKLSTPDRSVPRRGLTPGLLGGASPPAGQHDAGGHGAPAGAPTGPAGGH